jgi:hypothetical protein
VESFLPQKADIRIVLDDRFKRLRDAVSNEELTGKEIPGRWGRKSNKTGYDTTIKSHSFRVFQCE